MDNPLLSSDTSTLKELFQEPIYLIKEEFSVPVNPLQTNVESKSEILFQLKGENTKNIVFMVFSANKTLSDLEQDLYAKTLTGLKLAENEVAICMTEESNANQFELISKELKGQKVVCFGNSTSFSGDKLLKPTQVENTKFLACPSLSELSADQTLKVTWWTALKGFISA
jgi:hypothetical protein